MNRPCSSILSNYDKKPKTEKRFNPKIKVKKHIKHIEEVENIKIGVIKKDLSEKLRISKELNVKFRQLQKLD